MISFIALVIAVILWSYNILWTSKVDNGEAKATVLFCISIVEFFVEAVIYQTFK